MIKAATSLSDDRDEAFVPLLRRLSFLLYSAAMNRFFPNRNLFLLWMGQLVSLSGMAAFEAFRNLSALLDAGIVGVDT